MSLSEEYTLQTKIFSSCWLSFLLTLASGSLIWERSSTKMCRCSFGYHSDGRIPLAISKHRSRMLIPYNIQYHAAKLNSVPSKKHLPRQFESSL